MSPFLMSDRENCVYFLCWLFPYSQPGNFLTFFTSVILDTYGLSLNDIDRFPSCRSISYYLPSFELNFLRRIYSFFFENLRLNSNEDITYELVGTVSDVRGCVAAVGRMIPSGFWNCWLVEGLVCWFVIAGLVNECFG